MKASRVIGSRPEGTLIVEQTAVMRNSMLYDFDMGAKTEIDFINGAVVATGRRAAVPTPYNETIVRLVKAREALG